MDPSKRSKCDLKKINPQTTHYIREKLVGPTAMVTGTPVQRFLRLVQSNVGLMAQFKGCSEVTDLAGRLGYQFSADELLQIQGGLGSKRFFDVPRAEGG
eukprot:g35478.t1